MVSTRNGRQFRACIFDFDGVIVDSEPLHAQAKRLTLERFGIAFPPTLLDEFKGRTDVDFFDHVVGHIAPPGTPPAPLLAEKAERYLELFAEVPLMPGFSAFLKLARRRFDVIVTGEDTWRHKPDPAPYIEALARLAVTPGEALVIEDSPNGVRSARAAGTYVVAMTTAFAPGELSAAGADRLVAGFDGLSRILDEFLA